MSYFQLYEKKRNLYKKVQPGSVWENSEGGYTVVISSVNLSEGKIKGSWTSSDGSFGINDTIKWLLRHYTLVEE